MDVNGYVRRKGKIVPFLFNEIYIERTDAEEEKAVFEACLNDPTCIEPVFEPKGDGHYCVMVGWGSYDDRDKFRRLLEKKFPGWVTWR